MAYTELKPRCYLSTDTKTSRIHYSWGRMTTTLPPVHIFSPAFPFSLTGSPIHPNNNCLCNFIPCFFPVPLFAWQPCLGQSRRPPEDELPGPQLAPPASCLRSGYGGLDPVHHFNGNGGMESVARGQHHYHLLWRCLGGDLESLLHQLPSHLTWL